MSTIHNYQFKFQRAFCARIVLAFRTAVRWPKYHFGGFVCDFPIGAQLRFRKYVTLAGALNP